MAMLAACTCKHPREHKHSTQIIRDDKTDAKTKYRSFVIVYCKTYGYLLLRSYKKKKGEHHQLPGGRMDSSELNKNSMEEAARKAAKRELFEETGLNIDMYRFHHLNLEIKDRYFFELILDDNESLHRYCEYPYKDIDKSLNDKQTFYLKLSNEHNGFLFEKNVYKAMNMIKLHSGGKCSKALKMYAKNSNQRNIKSEISEQKKGSSLLATYDLQEIREDHAI